MTNRRQFIRNASLLRVARMGYSTLELAGYTVGRTQFEGVKGCMDYLMKVSFVK